MDCRWAASYPHYKSRGCQEPAHLNALILIISRWCQEPAHLNALILFGTRLRDYLEGLQAWQKANGQDNQTYLQRGCVQGLQAWQKVKGQGNLTCLQRGCVIGIRMVGYIIDWAKQTGLVGAFVLAGLPLPVLSPTLVKRRFQAKPATLRYVPVVEVRFYVGTCIRLQPSWSLLKFFLSFGWGSFVVPGLQSGSLIECREWDSLPA